MKFLAKSFYPILEDNHQKIVSGHQHFCSHLYHRSHFLSDIFEHFQNLVLDIFHGILYTIRLKPWIIYSRIESNHLDQDWKIMQTCWPSWFPKPLTIMTTPNIKTRIKFKRTLSKSRQTWMRVARVLLQLLATMSPFRLLSPLNVGSYPSSWGQNNQIFKIE